MRLLVTLAFAYLGAILLLLGNSVYFEGFAAFAIPAVGISLVLSSPFLAKLIADRLGPVAIGALFVVAIALLAVARSIWCSGFANNADADAIRFYSASLLALACAFPAAAFIVAMLEKRIQ
jgi:hypothetical protein